MSEGGQTRLDRPSDGMVRREVGQVHTRQMIKPQPMGKAVCVSVA